MSEPQPPTNTTSLTWRGAMSFDALTARGGIRIEGGPDRESLSPMDTLLAAVGACMGIDVVEILTKMRADVTSYRVVCEGWRRDQPPKSYTSLRLTHHLTGTGLDAASVERAVKLSQEKYCSAMASLDPGMQIENLIEIASLR